MMLSFEAAGGRVAGVLWYQGEADAIETSVPDFPAKLARLVAAMRADFGDPALPFYHVQLSRLVMDALLEEPWSAIREAQRVFGDATGMVAAVDLGMDDGVHVGTDGLKRLGRRLAHLASGRSQTLRLNGVELEHKVAVPTGEVAQVRVRFSGVEGSLQPLLHIGGFSVRDSTGTELNCIFKTEVVDGDSVRLWISPYPAEEAFLWYGYGLNPYCNRGLHRPGRTRVGPQPLPR